MVLVVLAVLDAHVPFADCLGRPGSLVGFEFFGDDAPVRRPSSARSGKAVARVTGKRRHDEA